MGPIKHKSSAEFPFASPPAEKRQRLDFSLVPKVEGMAEFDHPVSVCSNEQNREAIFETLRKVTIKRDTIIGVSGFFALDLAVQRGSLAQRNIKKIENVLIIDCSLRVWHFWQQVGKIVRRCKLRQSVIDRIKRLIHEQALYYYSKTCYKCCNAYDDADKHIKLLQDRIDRGLSWLSNDEYFQKGKKMFDEGRIYVLLSDITDPNTLKGVLDELDRENHSLDTLYLSNVFLRPYISEEARHALDENIPHNTFVIQNV